MILPDVRGLYSFYEELALRFAEAGIDALAIDYFGRTAGVAKRDAEFSYMEHVQQTRLSELRADVTAAAEELRRDGRVRATFTIGFCFGGRLSYSAGDLRPRPGRLDRLLRDARRRIDPATLPRSSVAPAMASPILGLFGGADQAIPAEAIAEFEAALDGGQGRARADHAIPVRRTASSTARRPTLPRRPPIRGPAAWPSSRPGRRPPDRRVNHRPGLRDPTRRPADLRLMQAFTADCWRVDWPAPAFHPGDLDWWSRDSVSGSVPLSERVRLWFDGESDASDLVAWGWFGLPRRPRPARSDPRPAGRT